MGSVSSSSVRRWAGDVAFGESPFRAKGTLYRATHSDFEHNLHGGFQALLDAIEEPELREFVGQHFLASTRYDVMPVPAIAECSAKVVGRTVEE